MRLRIFIGLIQTQRGERLDEFLADMQDILGDSTDDEDVFVVRMAESQVALRRGEHDRAYEAAIRALEVSTQNPDIAARAALHASIAMHDVDRIREAAAVIERLPGSGAVARARREWARAAVAAAEGRIAEAVAAFVHSHAVLESFGTRYDAALMVLDAATLLPDQPEIRALADAVRPLLEELRARAVLAELDAALARGEGSASAPATTAAGVPAS